MAVANPSSSPADRSPTATLLWCDLLNQLGWETEQLLGTALESLHALHHEGQPLSPAMLALRRKLEQARQLGMAGRQIARLAERSAPSAPPSEVLLSDELSAAVAQRISDLRARGIGVLRQLPTVTVRADRGMVGVLVRALVAWAVAHAEAEAEIRLDRPEASDASALLTCRLRHRAEASRPTRFAGPANWGAQWQLVRHAAQALGWEMRCGDDGPMSWLTLSFPCVWGRCEPTMEAIELCSGGTEPGACRVLLVSPEPGLRDAVSRALQPLDVTLDFADSAHEAERYCTRPGALPAAMLFDGAACGEPAAQVRERMRAAGGAPAVIEIAGGDEFDVDPSPGGRVGRVGRHSLAGGLPAALMLSLSGRAGAPRLAG